MAIVRVRGPRVREFVGQHVRLRGGRLLDDARVGAVWRGELLDDDRVAIDDILISVHATEPALDLRLHLHGSPWLVAACEKMLEALAFRTADDFSAPDGDDPDDVEEAVPSMWPAEDALAADAYALLPDILTEQGARWLLAQTGQLRQRLAELAQMDSLDAARAACAVLAERVMIPTWFLSPLRIALLGPPNAGKSTLANALADQAVSLVSPTPGTTRDWVEVPGEIAGLPVTWLDTAGFRPPGDPLETAGIAQAAQVAQGADVVVAVLDPTGSEAANDEAWRRIAQPPTPPAVVAWNKTDEVAFHAVRPLMLSQQIAADNHPQLGISAEKRIGLERLGQHVLAAVGRTSEALTPPAALSLRQYDLLREAAEAPDRDGFRGLLARCVGRAG